MKPQKDSNSTEESEQSLSAVKCLGTAAMEKRKHLQNEKTTFFCSLGLHVEILLWSTVKQNNNNKKYKRIPSLIYLLRDSHRLNNLKLASNTSVAFLF